MGSEQGSHLGLSHGHAVVARQKLLHNDGQAPEGVLLVHEQQQAACNEVHALHTHPSPFQQSAQQLLAHVGRCAWCQSRYLLKPSNIAYE